MFKNLFSKFGLKKKILKNINLPDDWFVINLNLSTARFFNENVEIYTEIKRISNDDWTSEFILYNIKTGERLTDFKYL